MLRRSDLDAMRAAIELQFLKRAVEVVDDADVEAVDVDARVIRLDSDPDSAGVAGAAATVDCHWRVGREPAVPRIVRAVVPTVVPAIQTADDAAAVAPRIEAAAFGDDDRAAGSRDGSARDCGAVGRDVAAAPAARARRARRKGAAVAAAGAGARAAARTGTSAAAPRRTRGADCRGAAAVGVLCRGHDRERQGADHDGRQKGSRHKEVLSNSAANQRAPKTGPIVA